MRTKKRVTFVAHNKSNTPKCNLRVIVAAVSYLNTVPMIHGIRCAGPSWLRDALALCPPVDCAKAFANGTADIALLPVGALPELDAPNIITDYCISATGKVKTVSLLSNAPIADVQTIWLDGHSRTSRELVRILADELWHITPEYKEGLPEVLGPYEAMLAIGDKVFELQLRYLRKTDLALAWQTLTGLPFVFAVWVAKPHVTSEQIAQLNAALQYGVQHIEDSLPENDYKDRNRVYLTQNIEFNLSPTKRQAMELFLQKLR